MQQLGDCTSVLGRPRRWWPLLIVVLAAIHLYCSPTHVAELEVVPDSVEYAVAAHRFATTGKYEIQVNGRALPPRYPPGFSVLFLAPVYAMAPGNIGNGIVVIWAAGVLAALFAYLIGEKLSGPWGGVLAAVLLLHHPQFANYTQVIMTDVPAVMLGLAAAWLYLRLREQKYPPTRIYLMAGVVVALSISIRPLTGLLVLPFLFDIARRRGDRPWRKLAALAIPAVIVIAATSFQQWHAFGDWRRTGYQFWLAVPYDYPALTFSPRYLKDNLEMFKWSYADAARANLLCLPIAFGSIGVLVLWMKRSQAVILRSSGGFVRDGDPARSLDVPNCLANILVFLLLTAIPLSAIHLFYFFRDIRFHFLTIALLSILGGAGIAALISESARRKGGPLLALIALLILIPRLSRNPLEEGKPLRFHIATECAKLLPPDAILISGVDPDYLEQMVARGTSRRILPLDRATPYATAILAWHRIPQLDPSPRNAADHACAGLQNGGDESLYAFTAVEATTQLHQWLKSGAAIYLELESRDASDPSVSALRAAFRFIPVSPQEPWLVRIAPAP